MQKGAIVHGSLPGMRGIMKYFEEVDKLREELEQVKNQRDSIISNVESIKERVEMAIDETDEFGWLYGLRDVKQQANDILAQYRSDTKKGETIDERNG